MKVSELIERLEACEPDAEVFIMEQPNWPFEVSVVGVITREEIHNSENEYDEDDEMPWDENDENGKENYNKELEAKREEFRQKPWKDRWGVNEHELPPEDVFILEGKQERYGIKSAWNNV